MSGAQLLLYVAIANAAIVFGFWLYFRAPVHIHRYCLRRRLSQARRKLHLICNQMAAGDFKPRTISLFNHYSDLVSDLSKELGP